MKKVPNPKETQKDLSGSSEEQNINMGITRISSAQYSWTLDEKGMPCVKIKRKGDI